MKHHRDRGLDYGSQVARVCALSLMAVLFATSGTGCAKSKNGGPTEIAPVMHSTQITEGLVNIAYFPRMEASPLLMYLAGANGGKSRLEYVSGRWVARHADIVVEAPPRAVICYDAGENAFLAASTFWDKERIDKAESCREFAQHVNTEMKASIAAANLRPTPPLDSTSFRVDSALGPLIGIYMVFHPRKEGVLLLSTSTNAPTPKLLGRRPGWWLELGERKIVVPDRSVILYLESAQEVVILGVNWQFTADDEARDKEIKQLIDDWMKNRR